jgi:hypothetical protein
MTEYAHRKLVIAFVSLSLINSKYFERNFLVSVIYAA